MFEEKTNFLFGYAYNKGPIAVISYRRFTADFNSDVPNRPRLIKRTAKQALSSIGFMLGVARCNDPTCPRAYPHSLAEHDAKSMNLCPACRAGFQKALASGNRRQAAGE
jgi:predicted Zn-dependent protease